MRRECQRGRMRSSVFVPWVQVCEYQSAAKAAKGELKVSYLEHPHATDASTAVTFTMQSGEPVAVVCTGIVHAEEPAVLGMTAAPGFANSKEAPRLQMVLQAMDANGMHCGGAAAARFVREHLAACDFSLEWGPRSGKAASVRKSGVSCEWPVAICTRLSASAPNSVHVPEVNST